MLESVAESIRKPVEDFFGGASFGLFRGEAAPDRNAQGDNLLVKNFTTEAGTYHLVLERRPLPFTATEQALAHELTEVLPIFIANRTSKTELVYFRTALFSSFLDVSVCRYLSHNRQRTYWSIQKLLQLLKNLSFQRYEGAPATSGVIVYRNRLEDFRIASSLADCLRHDFDPAIGISADFFKNPLTYRLVNGLGTYYMCNINLRSTGMIKFMNYGYRDAVERLSHRDILSLIDKAGKGAFATTITLASELEVMTCPDNLFVWKKGNWSLFAPDVFRGFLRGRLAPKELEALITTVYSLSKLRLGTLILIADENVLTSGNLQKGAVGGKDDLAQLIIGFFKSRTISSLKHSGELINILSADGLSLFNKDGELIDAGIIINTCTTPSLVTGGGRTTAAIAASMFGKVIKVSEDGPITLHEHGECVYRFG